MRTENLKMVRAAHRIRAMTHKMTNWRWDGGRYGTLVWALIETRWFVRRHTAPTTTQKVVQTCMTFSPLKTCPVIMIRVACTMWRTYDFASDLDWLAMWCDFVMSEFVSKCTPLINLSEMTHTLMLTKTCKLWALAASFSISYDYACVDEWRRVGLQKKVNYNNNNISRSMASKW